MSENKLTKILNKYLIYAIYGIFFVIVFNTCSTRGVKKENIKIKKEVDSLTTVIYELKNSTYNKEELNVRMDIYNLELAKQTLYDWNAIVRTAVRPDDRMNEYDQLIKAKREELKKLDE